MGRAVALLDRLGLQYRITASVGLGLAAILILFGYAAFWSVDQVTNAALLERQQLAVMLGQHVEALLDGQSVSGVDAGTLDQLLWLNDARSGSNLRVEILDGTGTAVVGSSRAAPLSAGAPAAGRSPAAHAALLADLIATRRAGIRVHRPPNGGSQAEHVVAYAPFLQPGPHATWGLTVEQTEDSMLWLPQRLRSRMLLFGAVALGLASTLAWFDARRVVRPLRQVTAAAQRIAAGDLTVPLAEVSAQRHDEVGRLTSALDTMRGRLVRSLAEISEWNQELERRVWQRTAELAAVSAQRRQLLNKVIWAQEEERKRLARELHDETVQTLSGLAMSLQAIEGGLPADLTVARDRLAWAKDQAVHAAREIRQLILDLRPSALDDLGLIPAVRWYATSHLEPLGVTVKIAAPEEPLELPALVQTAAFRVLQEALSNVARHAHATEVSIRISTDETTLWACVEDNGRGFDPEVLRAARLAAVAAPLDHPETGRGLGILGMQERVALLGGLLEIDPRRGGGTRIEFSIPLHAGSPSAEVAEEEQRDEKQSRVKSAMEQRV